VGVRRTAEQGAAGTQVGARTLVDALLVEPLVQVRVRDDDVRVVRRGSSPPGPAEAQRSAQVAVHPHTPLSARTCVTGHVTPSASRECAMTRKRAVASNGYSVTRSHSSRWYDSVDDLRCVCAGAVR